MTQIFVAITKDGKFIRCGTIAAHSVDILDQATKIYGKNRLHLLARQVLEDVRFIPVIVTTKIEVITGDHGKCSSWVFMKDNGMYTSSNGHTSNLQRASIWSHTKCIELAIPVKVTETTTISMEDNNGTQ